MVIGMQAGRSSVAYERAKRSLAAGVGSAARGTLVGYTSPLFAESAEGAWVRDVDGRSYIDYLLALGPLILGHRPPELRSAVLSALDRLGSMVGLSNDLEADAAERVVAAVPGIELVRFSNSGTEAVMMAMRIARAVTGRPLIVRFEGHFHGWSDVAHWSVKPELARAGDADAPVPVPAVQGIPSTLADSMIVLPWNDAEAVARVMVTRGRKIAAVITEPLMANYGCIEPRPGYLQRLRELTHANGSLLIFDEVVTGFRLALGGAQAYYDVIPDLTVLAKAIAGGYAVAAVGGSAEAMRPVARQELPYLGTYNTNPVAMAAVSATIGRLSEPGVYERLHSMGERLAGGLREAFHAAGLPATVRGPGTVFQIWFTNEPAFGYRDALKQTRPAFFQRFHEAMRARGVLFHPSQTEHFFISTAHSPELVDQTLDQAREAIAEIRDEFE